MQFEQTNYQTSPRLRDMVVGERPQERLQQYGARALSDSELLAIILRKGDSRQDIMGLVVSLLKLTGGLAGLMKASPEEYAQCRGVGPVKAAQLQAVCELSRRLLICNSDAVPSFDAPDTVFTFFQPDWLGLEVEKFWVLCLNRKNGLIKKVEVTSGTVSSSLVHPREVFREAIRAGSSAIIAVHNHPSGDPSPSSADLRVTRQLREAARIIDIDFLDHIIIGSREGDPKGTGFYSFNEAGLI